MKKLLTMLLAILMLMALLPYGAFADNASSGKCGDNATWKYSRGTLTISGTGAMTNYGYSEKTDEYAETPWLSAYAEAIKTVVIENGVTSIGNYAFYDCGNLTDITIPDSVKSIGDFAFSGCRKLSNITLPAGLTKIGDDAFDFCQALPGITIPDSTESIGSFAFYGCTGLKGFNVPASLTKIGNCLFYECTGLTTINVAGGNTKYASENGVLMSKDKTKLVCYPCGKQGAYTVPDHITAIGQGAFYGCSGLTQVTVPASVTEIEGFAFERCENLKSIDVAGGNAKYASADGVLFNKAKTELICCPGGMQGSYNIPAGVNTIRASAFEFCGRLTNVTIPAGVKSIEDSTFTACASLKSITIPDGVTKIGASAFDSCESLICVNIPDSVASIGKGAFSACKSLADVRIPSGLKNIGTYAFYGCSSLKSIAVPLSVNSVDLNAFDGCTALSAVNYEGSSAQWKSVDIKKYNEPLLKAKLNCNTKPAEVNPFVDVKSGIYYCDPVLWAYKHNPQITDGVDETHFQPDSTCTRAQIVTLLWRAKGCPAHKPVKCPFADVYSKSYYYDAVMWAVENGITKGVDATHFAPNAGCTRAQAVTFLWRADGQPETSNTSCPFNDVVTGDFYYSAMLWAVGEKITNGFDAVSFAPNNTCTRGQIVTFMCRDTNIK